MGTHNGCKDKRHRTAMPSGHPFPDKCRAHITHNGRYCLEKTIMYLGLDKGHKTCLVVCGNHQVRQHVLQPAGAERMMGMMVAIVMVTLAMTGDLRFKNKAFGFATVMMVMRHNSMQHDNCTCQ